MFNFLRGLFILLVVAFPVATLIALFPKPCMTIYLITTFGIGLTCLIGGNKHG